jgi:hypothetical protein
MLETAHIKHKVDVDSYISAKFNETSEFSCPLVPEKRYLSFRQISPARFSMVSLESSFDIVIREFSLWVHSCQEVDFP